MAEFTLPKGVVDRSGLRYSRLIVLRAVPRPPTMKTTSSFVWLCRCDCGQEKLILTGPLLSGSSKSCGCLKREASWVHVGNTTHGRSSSPEYASWKAMRRRCNNTRHPKYLRYGGRGIKICEQWSAFEQFFADMGERPSLLHSIERIDNDGDYTPVNCRWATKREQSANRCDSYVVDAFGRRASLAAFFESSRGADYERAHYRIGAGWDVERAIVAPPWHK